MRYLLKYLVTLLFAISLVAPLSAELESELREIEMPDGTEIEIRIFPADGDRLLLGFACDAGAGLHEEETASALSEDGIEVWMPDMLSGYMLPKLKSSVESIPTEDVIALLDKAVAESDKKIYLIASGPDTDLLLRGVAHWEELHPDDTRLKGAILLFPRLNAGKPEPGMEPVYKESVGKTKTSLMLFEGGRTPNRWGVKHLSDSLSAGGSTVHSKVIPSVRGYFFKREDANLPEETVTFQLAGLIKAGLFYLREPEE